MQSPGAVVIEYAVALLLAEEGDRKAGLFIRRRGAGTIRDDIAFNLVVSPGLEITLVNSIDNVVVVVLVEEGGPGGGQVIPPRSRQRGTVLGCIFRLEGDRRVDRIERGVVAVA